MYTKGYRGLEIRVFIVEYKVISGTLCVSAPLSPVGKPCMKTVRREQEMRARLKRRAEDAMRGSYRECV